MVTRHNEPRPSLRRRVAPTRIRALFAAPTLILVALASRRATACGVSGVDGVSSCSLAEHNEAVRPRWAVSASGVYTSTRLRFSGDVHGDQTRYAALAALAY